VSHSKAAYLVGFALCATSVIVSQITLSYWLTPGTAQYSEVVKDIGYTFTGLTAAIGFFLWRWGKRTNTSNQSKIGHWNSRILQAIAAMIPILFGCAYFCIAGKQVERHARTFAALPPFVYLLVIVGQKNVSNVSSDSQKAQTMLC